MQQLLSFLRELQANLRFADLLDIGIIAGLLYFVLAWLRQKTSRSIVLGVALISLVYVLARRLDMYLTSLLFQAGLTALLVALALLFQDEIRRLLERVISWSALPGDRNRLDPPSRTLDTLVEAVGTLARKRIGALIVIAGRESLERHVRGGVPLRGRISVPLLHSLFHTATPGHDGAALVEGDKIDRFGVHLPLSRNLAAVGSAGTRHAAALGLAECCDALVIVVSEERGTISIAEQGRLETVTSSAGVKARLEAFRRRLFPARVGRAPRWPVRNLGAKSLAVVLAVLLWLLFAYRVETVQRAFPVPIEYRNVGSGLEVDDDEPTAVRVHLSGSARVFDLLDPSTMVLAVDLEGLERGRHVIQLDPAQLNRPSGLAVIQLDPRALTIRVRPLASHGP